MRKVITLLYLSLSLLSCGQKKEIKKENIMNEDNIQKIVNIYKEVKVYNYNPSYTLHINAAGFSFELLINDNPIFSHYDSGNITGSVPINSSLLTSGKQKIKFKITPDVNKEYKFEELLYPDNMALEFTIDCGDYGKQKVKDFNQIFKYTMPKLKESLPYYEINLEFEAEIPYQLSGWTNSVDLSKENKEKLKSEVENFYREMIDIYESKNVNILAGKYYNRTLELQQVGFENKPGDTQKIIDEWIKDINDTRPFVFDQYELKFYGNGRMIALVKTDKYYLNFSSLMREDTDGNYTCYGLVLHRPEVGGSLEVIR